MTKCSKDRSGNVVYTSDLRQLMVTEQVLRTLIDEGKFENLKRV